MSDLLLLVIISTWVGVSIMLAAAWAITRRRCPECARRLGRGGGR